MIYSCIIESHPVLGQKSKTQSLTTPSAFNSARVNICRPGQSAIYPVVLFIWLVV